MPLHGIKTPHLSELYIPIPTKHLSALLVARQQLSSSLLSPSHHVIPGVPPPLPFFFFSSCTHPEKSYLVFGLARRFPRPRGWGVSFHHRTGLTLRLMRSVSKELLFFSLPPFTGTNRKALTAMRNQPWNYSKSNSA